MVFVKGLKKCTQSIGVVDELLEKMGIMKDYDKTMLKEMGSTLGTLLLILLVITVNSFSLFVKDTPVHVKIILVLSTHYPIILIFVADMTFLCLVR